MAADVATVLAAIRAAPKTRVGPVTQTSKSAAGYDYVNQSPSALAAQAQMDLDTYALARMVSSEYGGRPAEEMLGAAECAVNQAAHLGITIARLLTHASIPSRGTDGFFARNGSGHWASTIQDPNQKHLTAAQGAIAGTTIAMGARDFFSPGGQKVGATQGDTILTRSSQQVIDDNAKNGLVWVGPIDGISQASLMMFVDQSKVADPSTNTADATAGIDKISVIAFLFALGTIVTIFAVSGVIGVPK